MAQEEYSYLLKYVIIGDEEVGKSSLLQQYVHDNFSESYVPTIGVDFGVRTTELSGARIKLQVWDTAGQERFQSVCHSYYRGASAVFIVYDITSRSSFNHVSDWIENVRRFSGDQTCVCLLGNKTDLEEDREVTYDEGKECADDNDLLFLECSARTKENLKKAFQDLTEKVYQQRQDNSKPDDADGLVVEIWDKADKVSLMTLSSNTKTSTDTSPAGSTDPTPSGTRQQPSTTADSSASDSGSDSSSSDDATHDPPFITIAKCVIIGESGAGKSCLLKQFAEKKFAGDIPHTIGVEFESRVVWVGGDRRKLQIWDTAEPVGGARLKLQIWDTAGQERFRAITRAYYRGAKGVLIVYDITRRDTFSKLTTWITEAKTIIDDGTVMFLIGNKADLEAERCVTFDEGKQFAEENGMGFTECSAKTGDNVHDAFIDTSKKIHEKMQESGRCHLDPRGLGVGLDTVTLSAPTQGPYEVGCPC